MKINRLYIYLIFFIPILFINCRKDSDKFVPNNDSGGKYSSTVSGYVYDEAQQLVVGADVESGGKRTKTNSEGFFVIKDVQSNEKLSVIIQKAGYFKGCRTLFISKGGINDVKMTLLKKEFLQSFSASSGGKVSLNDKITIDFPANAIVNSSGASYSGVVKVAMKYLNPTESSIASIMPGALVGIDKNASQKALESYGMVGVELEDESGQSLQIKADNFATLSVLIPDNLLQSAGKTIPLWSFDYSTGLWKEEGEATLDGKRYVGKVNHFSFWNYDYPFESINLSGKVINENGQPFSVRVKLINQTTKAEGYGYTNLNGEFGGIVPKNVKFSMKIYDYCNNLLYEQEIGPFNSDETLTPITLKIPIYNLTVSGIALNCKKEVLKNGIVTVYSESGYRNYTFTNDKGEFNVSILNCAFSKIYYTIYDIDNMKISNEQFISVVTGNIYLGNIDVCNSIDEYIKVHSTSGSIDTVLINNLKVKVDTLKLNINAGLNSSFNLLTNDIKNSSTSIDITNFIFVNGKNYFFSTFNKPPTENIINFKILPVNLGEYYEGDFKINNILKEGTQEYHDFSGSFRIKKK